MRYGKIYTFDTANGPGIRTVLFVSGCPHHCDGCFNPETWDYGYGEPYTEGVEELLLGTLEHPEVDGLTILGGEPLARRNSRPVTLLCRRARERYPQKSIWVYTGYLWEGVKQRTMMDYIDVLVDGPFVKAEKDLRLAFRGSGNQRIIDVQESLKRKQVVLLERYMNAWA